MGSLENFVWHRVIRWFQKLHRWRWRDVRRHHTGPHGGRDRLFSLASVRISRLPLQGQHNPQSLDGGAPHLTDDTVESPFRGNTHGGFSERPAETERWQHRHRAPGRLHHEISRHRRPNSRVCRLIARHGSHVIHRRCPYDSAEGSAISTCSETDCGRSHYARGLCNNCTARSSAGPFRPASPGQDRAGHARVDQHSPREGAPP